MASSSSSSFFDPTSPFVQYCTDASRGVLLGMLRVVAQNDGTTPTEAVRSYFDGNYLAEKLVGFKQLLNGYFQSCYKEYMITHQQIADGTKQLSNLGEDNLDEYVYCVMQNIMSQNNGYKHLNCVFDGAMVFCVLQFKYAFASLTRDGFTMVGTTSSRGGNFSIAETRVLRQVIDIYLKKANEKFAELHVNGDQYKNYCLTCDTKSDLSIWFGESINNVNENGVDNQANNEINGKDEHKEHKQVK